MSRPRRAGELRGHQPVERLERGIVQPRTQRIVQPGRQHSHALKQVLQDRGIPPWRRARLPLLSDGEDLLAAGDVILSARLDAWLRARGARLHWNALA